MEHFMNAISRTLIAVAALGVCSSPAFAAKLACKPDVKVVNEKQASIKVLKFNYMVGSDDFTESLNNRKIGANGDHETWKSQKLGHAAKGIAISKIAVEFKNDNSGEGDGYGKPTTTGWITQTGTCDNDRTYTITVR
jgi:hypothetical protein